MRANRVDHLWTLTYRDPSAGSWSVRSDVRRLFVNLQKRLGRTPIVAVIERGKRRTERFHVHLALRGWFAHHDMEQAWGHGFVFVSNPEGLRPVGGSAELASYLAKYLTKDGDEEQLERGVRALGENRWFRTQGFTPVEFKAVIHGPARALAFVERAYAIPEKIVAWGEPTEDPAFGYWMTFPERAQWAPPRIGARPEGARPLVLPASS